MTPESIKSILKPSSNEVQLVQKTRVQKRFWCTLKKAFTQVPFIDEIVAAYYCAMDPETPTHVRGVLLAALTYFIIPIDFIPDFLALVGFSDDISVLSAAFLAVKSHILPAHRKKAQKKLEEFSNENNE